MTANAMQGDREKCLEAGMNDYVSKPISPGAVAEALDRWLSTPSAASSYGGNPAQPNAISQTSEVSEDHDRSQRASASPGGNGLVFDRSAFLERMMGDEDLAQVVMNEFLKDIPKQIEGLRLQIELRDAENAGAQAHKIKGAAANIGGIVMSALACELEKAGKMRDLNMVKTLLPELEREFERLQKVMRGERA
jgi:HPt (histidine-containing phosphotransfer) domain-containing protein